MRWILATGLLLLACDISKDKAEELETRIDELEKKIDQSGGGVDREAATKLTALDVRVATAERDIAKNADRAEEALVELAGIEKQIADLESAPEPIEEPPPEPPPDEPKATSATSKGPVGIPICDEYISKYRRCVDTKMPEAAREATLKALNTTVKAWKQAADGPGRDALTQACKTALETVKKATQAMGCEF